MKVALSFVCSIIFLGTLRSVRGQSDEEEVALIIGGIEFCTNPDYCSTSTKWDLKSLPNLASECTDHGPGIKQLDKVEIFGCSDAVNAYLNIPPYPYPVTFASGLWLPHEKKVIVCGGVDCFSVSGFGKSHSDCFWWDPYSDDLEWQPTDSMTQGRTAHILGTIDELMDGESVTRVFAVGGYPDTLNKNFTTEIWRNDGWERYSDLPPQMEPHDNNYGCMFQDGTNLYSVRNKVIKLDLLTWKITNFGDTPYADSDGRVGQCAKLRKDNKRGVMIRGGHWFNLDDEIWERAQSPPLSGPFEIFTMVSLNGRPTIFGKPYCGEGDIPNDTYCQSGDEIIQYINETNRWVEIGNMLNPRIGQEIIPIPKSVCDVLIKTTTSTTTSSSSHAHTSTSTDPTTTTSSSSLMKLQVFILLFTIAISVIMAR